MGAMENFLFFSVTYRYFLNHTEIGPTDIAVLCNTYAFLHPIFKVLPSQCKLGSADKVQIWAIRPPQPNPEKCLLNQMAGEVLPGAMLCWIAVGSALGRNGTSQ